MSPDAPTADQHRDPLAGQGVLPQHRPEPGPIALLPIQPDHIATAVRSAGGDIAPLSEATRGLIWLSEKRAEELLEVLTAHPQIGWVQLPWAGVDGFASVLPRFAGSVRPLFTSAKGAYSEPVAEHALALALAIQREFAPKARAARWAEARTGLSLYGCRITIVGAGGICAELIRLLQPWRPHITVVRRADTPMAGADRTVTTAELPSLLPQTDVLILAAASTGATRHLIGAAELAALPSRAALVNIARGALIDTDALVAALAAGHILGAGLDVTDPEPLPPEHALWQEPRALITSHSADTPEMTAPLLAARIAENTRAFVGDGKFVGIVDAGAGY